MNLPKPVIWHNCRICGARMDVQVFVTCPTCRHPVEDEYRPIPLAEAENFVGALRAGAILPEDLC